MFRYRVEFNTAEDIIDFVNIVSAESGEVKLIDGSGFCVSGKSLLGAIATVEWTSLYCESENDIYLRIQKYCK